MNSCSKNKVLDGSFPLRPARSSPLWGWPAPGSSQAWVPIFCWMDKLWPWEEGVVSQGGPHSSTGAGVGRGVQTLGTLGPGLRNLLTGSETQVCAVETWGLHVCQCRSHFGIPWPHDSDLPRTASPSAGRLSRKVRLTWDLHPGSLSRHWP